LLIEKKKTSSQIFREINFHTFHSSLTVACKSNNSARRNAANKILNKIREHSETLVEQVHLWIFLAILTFFSTYFFFNFAGHDDVG